MNSLEEKIQNFIEEDINPGLASHGGFLDVRDFDAETGTLYVKMGGGCQGCAGASQTMLFAIDQLLKEEFSEIQEVVDVTDHAEGDNPYYA